MPSSPRDPPQATRWTMDPARYVGTIKLYGVSNAWKKMVPGANFLIKYSKKLTGDALDGDEGAALTATNYGRSEWWLLLEPKAAGQ